MESLYLQKNHFFSIVNIIVQRVKGEFLEIFDIAFPVFFRKDNKTFQELEEISSFLNWRWKLVCSIIVIDMWLNLGIDSNFRFSDDFMGDRS